MTPAYLSEEKAILSAEGYEPETIEKAQEFAAKTAWKDTDRATYQAMEALLHNLNTMHSRSGA